MRFTSKTGGALGAVTLALGLSALSAPAYAAPIACDAAVLVSAVKAANAAGGGTIHLAANCVYTLHGSIPGQVRGANGLPVIRERITIKGDNSVIERSSAPGTPEFRIAEVGGTKGDLTLNGVTLRNGNLAGGGEGGAVYVNDHRVLTVKSSILTNNTAATGGGAIRNNGTATITGSIVSDNHARAGGGIYAYGDTTTIVSSTVSGNEAVFGGGIGNEISKLTLRSSDVRDNSASSQGGGIINLANATLAVENSQIRDNSGGAFGGGVSNFGKVTMSGSSVRGNSAADAGGIANSGTLDVNSSRIDGNRADSWGGGLSNYAGTATLTGTSVTGNSAVEAGGIYEYSGMVALVSSPVTTNTPNNCRPEVTLPGCTD
ncbi:right-handed parallel beta-helix repeat-containing protein [Streptomyces sp. NPDC006332]|uniref:right-handed parallel beta-helix repeat-containing protein n=1 Tax=Streptomyces sp. NPDC006332 TaxID=3155456 RepID=UPI0033B16F02